MEQPQYFDMTPALDAFIKEAGMPFHEFVATHFQFMEAAEQIRTLNKDTDSKRLIFASLIREFREWYNLKYPKGVPRAAPAPKAAGDEKSDPATQKMLPQIRKLTTELTNEIKNSYTSMVKAQEWITKLNTHKANGTMPKQFIMHMSVSTSKGFFPKSQNLEDFAATAANLQKLRLLAEIDIAEQLVLFHKKTLETMINEQNLKIKKTTIDLHIKPILVDGTAVVNKEQSPAEKILIEAQSDFAIKQFALHVEKICAKEQMNIHIKEEDKKFKAEQLEKQKKLDAEAEALLSDNEKIGLIVKKQVQQELKANSQTSSKKSKSSQGPPKKSQPKQKGKSKKKQLDKSNGSQTSSKSSKSKSSKQSKSSLKTASTKSSKSVSFAKKGKNQGSKPTQKKSTPKKSTKPKSTKP